MKKNTHKNVHSQKGIALVISLIMMTLLLSVSFSISNIILRQLRLTNAGVSSQIAFYAADSALECVLYYDTSSDGTVEGSLETAYFGTSTPGSYADGDNPVKCGANFVSEPLSFIKVSDSSTDIATTTFDIDFENGSCARVEVVKSPFRTKISTNGYNTTANAARTGCDLTNAVARRVVERALVFSH